MKTFYVSYNYFFGGNRIDYLWGNTFCAADTENGKITSETITQISTTIAVKHNLAGHDSINIVNLIEVEML